MMTTLAMNFLQYRQSTPHSTLPLSFSSPCVLFLTIFFYKLRLANARIYREDMQNPQNFRIKMNLTFIFMIG